MLLKNNISRTEIVTIVFVLGLLVILALPSYQEIIERYRIKAPSEQLLQDLRFAFLEAEKFHKDVFVSFKTGDSWCYGFSDTGPCDCSMPQQCKYQDTEKVIQHTNFYHLISLKTDGFSNQSGISYVKFDKNKGAVDLRGSFSYTLHQKELSVLVYPNGREKICSSIIPGYKQC